MKTKQFGRVAGIGIFVFAMFALTLPSAHAADGTIQANVMIAEEISVVGQDALVFGKLSAPTDNLGAWTVNALNGPLMETVASNSVDLDLNDHSRGGFMITGEPSSEVDYTVAVTTNFADPSLNLVNITTDPVSSQLLDAGGQLAVLIGGTLEISPGAASGLHADAVITLTANYTP